MTTVDKARITASFQVTQIPDHYQPIMLPPDWPPVIRAEVRQIPRPICVELDARGVLRAVYHTGKYPCRVVHPKGPFVGGGSCALSASYFAIDNRARYGHVCRMCWRALSVTEQELYQEGT